MTNKNSFQLVSIVRLLHYKYSLLVFFINCWSPMAFLTRSTCHFQLYTTIVFPIIVLASSLISTIPIPYNCHGCTLIYTMEAEFCIFQWELMAVSALKSACIYFTESPLHDTSHWDIIITRLTFTDTDA